MTSAECAVALGEGNNGRGGFEEKDRRGKGFAVRGGQEIRSGGSAPPPASSGVRFGGGSEAAEI